MFNIEMFRTVLEEQVVSGELSELTKDEYISCLMKLERRCVNKEGASAGIVEAAINNLCKNNERYAKYIAAVRKYEKDVLNSTQILLYGEPLARLRAKSRKLVEIKKLACSEETYAHKINALKDEKMKLAFRLQKASGLRVAELADLEKCDVVFDSENMTFDIHVRNGKGKKSRTVVDINDAYLFEHLQEHVEQISDGEKLFYSASMMKKKAGELGMETHDLRRINARVNFRNEIENGASRYEARRKVGKKLGHSNPKTTTGYIGSEW